MPKAEEEKVALDNFRGVLHKLNTAVIVFPITMLELMRPKTKPPGNSVMEVTRGLIRARHEVNKRGPRLLECVCHFVSFVFFRRHIFILTPL